MRAVSRSLFVFAILVAFVFTAGFCETATAESDAEAQAAYELVALNTKISIQFDTMFGEVDIDTFLSDYGIVDTSAEIVDFGRGFLCFSTADGLDFNVAKDSITDDPRVNRVYPVYGSSAGSLEFGVTDLIIVRFEAATGIGLAMDVLDNLDLIFMDSSQFSHNLWRVALSDTVVIPDPVQLAWELQQLEGVEWATPSTYTPYERLSCVRQNWLQKLIV